MFAQMLRRPLVIRAGAATIGAVPRLAIAGADLAGVAILVEPHALRQHEAGGTLDAAVEGLGEAGWASSDTRRTAVVQVVSKWTVRRILLQ